MYAMLNRPSLAATALLTFCVVITGCAAANEAPPAPVDAVDEGPETAEDVSDLTSAKVTLRIPLLDEDGKLLSRHNAALSAAGLGTFPDVVEINGGANGAIARTATKKWDDASALVDKAYEKINLEIAQRSYGEPYSYQTRDPNTTICYRGNPMLVVSLINNLADRVFSDQLGVHGWRYRQTKWLDDNLTSDDEATFPTIWKTWRGRGAAVLVLSHSSDDGSETNVGIISKCAAP
jgi:hypothetical protein